MLADVPISAQAGRLGEAIHLQGTARYDLLDFIAEELPRWRDHPQRKAESAETALTGQLCAHLNSAARFSAGWSRVQFSTEIRDEVQRGRSIDLAPRPCGAIVTIEGRRHTQFDMLFPIECKRLPTPKGTDRDVREYVVTEHGTTGGIQRFKLGLHGAAHEVAAMIAYVQENGLSYWLKQVNGWITDLSEEDPAWNSSDLLREEKVDASKGLCVLHSRHQRGTELRECELRHLWIKMN